MADNDQILQELKSINSLLHELKKDNARLELKIEASHDSNEKGHAEIMEKLVESNEINGQEVKTLEKRVDRLEEHTGLAKPS